MRYAQRGGYTPAEQQRRERLRLEAAGRFARGDSTPEIAADLRVTERTVRRWRQAWRDGGAAALRSRGPVSRERLSPWQWARLELELGKGPLAHGFAGDQRWTLGRIKTLIGKLFHVGYTVEGTWRLLRQHGWSCQVPVRYRPGDRPHLFCQLGAYRPPQGRAQRVHLGRLPGPDHHCPPPAGRPAGLGLG